LSIATQLARLRRTVATRWWMSTTDLIRFTPLFIAVLAAAIAAKVRKGHWRAPGARQRRWQPGLSVLIPERGTPDRLGETLDALALALAMIEEPVEVVVMVNGAPIADYAGLRLRHPSFVFRHSARALGYNGAIRAGLDAIRHDWVYLLNSDMRVAADTIAQLLPYRMPHVFAATSQIFFADATRRREETGWSDVAIGAESFEMFEREPERSAIARGNLYPGGGSSLCRTRVLRRYVRATEPYRPFYFEDAEWGLKAWQDGWEVLFVPRSHAWHHHRATVGRFYRPAEVDRVFARNALQFELRHGLTPATPPRLMARVTAADGVTKSELSGIGTAAATFAARYATRCVQRRGFDFTRIARDKFYPAPRPRRGPRVLIVTPFALFPPAHGGARRLAELTQRLSSDAELILLSDERSAYGAQAQPWFEHFAAVHLIEGRGDQPGDAPADLGTRIRRHAHWRLRGEVERLVAAYDPDIVQIEYMELAALAALRRGRARWLLTLHDVYLGGQPGDAASDRFQHDLLRRFDTLVACSHEDAALLPHAHVALIGNGAVDRRRDCAASPDSPPRLLFMGPLRYAPNLDGLREFLATAWPALRTRTPTLELVVLGGVEAGPIAAAEACLAQPGVQVIAHFVEPAAHLAAATLTINPQRDIRGSSIKLIESLLAGRVCVSTRDGARGFLNAGIDGLAVADGIAGMAHEISVLLDDRDQRHRRERADAARLDAFTWDAVAQRHLALYRSLSPRCATAS
jgi:GT2 family glycosyltransferase/glycosyltransferase involved in cell wall biosynthesis